MLTGFLVSARVLCSSNRANGLGSRASPSQLMDGSYDAADAAVLHGRPSTPPPHPLRQKHRKRKRTVQEGDTGGIVGTTQA